MKKQFKILLFLAGVVGAIYYFMKKKIVSSPAAAKTPVVSDTVPPVLPDLAQSGIAQLDYAPQVAVVTQGTSEALKQAALVSDSPLPLPAYKVIPANYDDAIQSPPIIADYPQKPIYMEA